MSEQTQTLAVVWDSWNKDFYLKDAAGETVAIVCVGDPKAPDGDRARAYAYAAAALMHEALTWAVEYMEQYEGDVMPGWREFQIRGRAALAAAAPPARAAADGRREDDRR